MVALVLHFEPQGTKLYVMSPFSFDCVVYLTLFSKPMLQRLQSECSNQYKVNTYHYINYQDYGCTLNSNYGKQMFKRYIQKIQILTEV
jgi:hypothetical protein